MVDDALGGRVGSEWRIGESAAASSESGVVLTIGRGGRGEGRLTILMI